MSDCDLTKEHAVELNVITLQIKTCFSIIAYNTKGIHE